MMQQEIKLYVCSLFRGANGKYLSSSLVINQEQSAAIQEATSAFEHVILFPYPVVGDSRTTNSMETSG
jgi:hypothetical protein